VGYRVSNAGPRRLRGSFAVECNWGLQVPEAEDRFVEVDGAPVRPPHFAARAEHAACRRVAFVDRWAGRRLEVSWSEPGTLRRAPVETVSLSEAGGERVFQATEAVVAWPLELAPGASWVVSFAVEPRGEPPAGAS
jgi:hypothetical protein